MQSKCVYEPTDKVGAGIWSVGRNISAAWKEDVRLPCDTVGQPQPNISWSHEGTHVKQLTNQRFVLSFIKSYFINIHTGLLL